MLESPDSTIHDAALEDFLQDFAMGAAVDYPWELIAKGGALRAWVVCPLDNQRRICCPLTAMATSVSGRPYAHREIAAASLLGLSLAIRDLVIYAADGFLQDTPYGGQPRVVRARLLQLCHLDEETP